MVVKHRYEVLSLQVTLAFPKWREMQAQSQMPLKHPWHIFIPHANTVKVLSILPPRFPSDLPPCAGYRGHCFLWPRSCLPHVANLLHVARLRRRFTRSRSMSSCRRPALAQVMKMLMPLLTPAAGNIHFQLPEGAALAAGDLIAVLDLDDPGAVTAASPYPGGFPELGPPLVHSQGVDYRFKEAYSASKMILEGACICLPAVIISRLFLCLHQGMATGCPPAFGDISHCSRLASQACSPTSVCDALANMSVSVRCPGCPFAGYEHPVDQVVEDLLSCLDDPALALLQWNEAFGVVQVWPCTCSPCVLLPSLKAHDDSPMYQGLVDREVHPGSWAGALLGLVLCCVHSWPCAQPPPPCRPVCGSLRAGVSFNGGCCLRKSCVWLGCLGLCWLLSEVGCFSPKPRRGTPSREDTRLAAECRTLSWLKPCCAQQKPRAASCLL